MAEKVTISAELQERLAGANGDAVPLCDAAGKVVGYYLTAEVLGKLDRKRRALLERWTDEDVARIEAELANDPRPDVPHAEVMRWFEGQ